MNPTRLHHVALATLVTLCSLALRPATAAEQPLRERLQPVNRDSGFRMPGYFVWCGSAIKVGATYHLFAARWPETTKFPEGYRQHSEIVRATAARPEGPYTFQEVVIGARAAGRWDSGMAHNPAIYRVDPQPDIALALTKWNENYTVN